MTVPTKQRLLIAFSCVLVGCAVGATMPRLTAQSFSPNPTAPRWEQFCDEMDDSGVALTNTKLASRGRAGWELVAVHQQVADGDPWLCYKRPMGR